MAETSASLTPAALELKRRGRRRLIGAATIALLLIVFVPMLLDSEPRRAGKDIAVTIPAKEGLPALPAPNAAAIRVDAKPGDAKPAGDVATAPASAPVTASPPTAAPTSPAPMAASAVKAESPTATKAESKAEARPPSKPEAKADAKPVPAAVPIAPAPAKPEAKAVKVPEKDAKPAAKSAETRTEVKLEGFAVQLGAFSDAEKVKQLLAKLKAAKIPAFTEQIKGDAGPLTRVRAGPYKTRELADKGLAQVKRAGTEGKVVPLP